MDFSSLIFKQAIKKQRRYRQVVELSKVTKNTFFMFDKDEPIDVKTIIGNEQETQNVMKRGDVLVTGPRGESYVMPTTKFVQLYNIVDCVAVPRKLPKMVAHVTKRDLSRPITFTAPWGEQMILKPGDYLVKDGNGYYRIESSVFKETYIFSR